MVFRVGKAGREPGKGGAGGRIKKWGFSSKKSNEGEADRVIKSCQPHYYVKVLPLKITFLRV